MGVLSNLVNHMAYTVCGGRSPAPRQTSGLTPKRSLKGLWHGKKIQSGHRVSFSERKHLRKWTPNVKKMDFRSEVFNTTLTVPVTMHALKCIERAGGLDQYVYNSRVDVLGKGLGWDLRSRMRAMLKMKKEDEEWEKNNPIN
eukprot:Nk52_evm23s160 gene=Nk52_evmTU23s160